MTETALIAGAGGFGREILQYLRDLRFPLEGFLDDRADALAGFDLGTAVLGRLADFPLRDEHRLVIGVGDPAGRRRLGDAAAARGARFLTLVHPTAYVAPNARLGPGCVVCPFAFIGVGAVLGDHVAVNTYASVGHDAQVGHCSVFSALRGGEWRRRPGRGGVPRHARHGHAASHGGPFRQDRGGRSRDTPGARLLPRGGKPRSVARPLRTEDMSSPVASDRPEGMGIGVDVEEIAR